MAWRNINRPYDKISQKARKQDFLRSDFHRNIKHNKICICYLYLLILPFGFSMYFPFFHSIRSIVVQLTMKMCLSWCYSGIQQVQQMSHQAECLCYFDPEISKKTSLNPQHSNNLWNQVKWTIRCNNKLKRSWTYNWSWKTEVHKTSHIHSEHTSIRNSYASSPAYINFVGISS